MPCFNYICDDFGSIGFGHGRTLCNQAANQQFEWMIIISKGKKYVSELFRREHSYT
jgi:hypothetical protein